MAGSSVAVVNGAILVGSGERPGASGFRAVEASTGNPLEPVFHEADRADVADACELAAKAADLFANLAPAARAAFLEEVAVQVGALGDVLIERAMLETGLPRGRLEGERTRTVRQLQMFAAVVREGGWLDATIDPAEPLRAPLPRPDLRRCHQAIGPVAVFGASNFPLAFSVAGGDTASALAAGCPVVVKGHPAHPGTGELVARAVLAAVQGCRLPAGVFSYLPGSSNELGAALVGDPRIRAVGFTGSRAGGLALSALAAARPEPIPVHAEMSSVNPVVLLPAAAHARGAALAGAYAASLAMGAGQFCTNPGLLVGLAGADLDAFIEAAGAAIGATAAQLMLSPGILASYERGTERMTAHAGVRLVASGTAGTAPGRARAALYTVSARDFLADPALSAEIFGATSLVVRAGDMDELVRVLGSLEGQLTATLLFDPADEVLATRLMPLLVQMAGRVLANGWPTGVEVCPAMVHGGPFPATSDARGTSVGTLAMQRFLRPVCYQNLPDSLLPPALRSDNPWRLARRVDGVLQPKPDGLEAA